MTIVNEVDGEEVPGVPEDFQYLEHGYDWGRYAPDVNFLVGCDCVGNCNSVDGGSCCIRHFDGNPEEFMEFWYDKRVCPLHKCVFGITDLTSGARACFASIPQTYCSKNAIW